MVMPNKLKSDPFCNESAENFHSQLCVNNNECWIWLGAKESENGYGSYSWGINYNQRVHRWMYEYFYKEKPGSFYVCHHCDNKSCANPLHLYLGTAKDNAQDVRVRGRNYYTKLTSCKFGHAFTKENTYKPPNKYHRYCRTCINMRGRKYYLEIKSDKKRLAKRNKRIKRYVKENPRPYNMASYIYGFIRRLAIKDGYL